MRPTWIVKVYRTEVETRWWWKRVLRRRYRYRLVTCKQPISVHLSHRINGPDTCEVTITAVDPFEYLARVTA